MTRAWFWLCALALLAFSPGADQVRTTPVPPATPLERAMQYHQRQPASFPTMLPAALYGAEPVAPKAIEPAPPVTAPATDEIFFYSYYYPDLLAPEDVVDGICANQDGALCHTVNCWDFDLLTGRCRSAMASGLDWREYIGKALACGYEYSLGTVFRVLEPASLAGDYPCLDRCPDCTSKRLLDFISAYQALPWQTELLVQVDP